jgi:CRISPR-associated endonuclease/helicase Cas3
MIWPLWRQPLDPYAVSVLLEHPALRPRFDDGRVTVDPGSWPALGIFAVGSAERRPVPESKSAGVLTPSIVHLARARR